MSDTKNDAPGLLNAPLHVVNVGLEGFAQDLEAHDVPVVQVEWSPPARGNAKLADLLSKLSG